MKLKLFDLGPEWPCINVADLSQISRVVPRVEGSNVFANYFPYFKVRMKDTSTVVYQAGDAELLKKIRCALIKFCSEEWSHFTVDEYLKEDL